MLSEYADFFYQVFAYYDSPLPIGSDEIIQMWLNNPQCGHGDSSDSMNKQLNIKNLFFLHIILTTKSAVKNSTTQIVMTLNNSNCDDTQQLKL